MRYLVDANVLSEPTRSVPDPEVISWLRDHEPELAVDPIILGEIRYGILFLPDGAKKSSLETWFSAGVMRLRCLEWDSRCALAWSDLLARLRAERKAMPYKDSLIAASALSHSLVLVTRNTADFVHTGVKLLNPFSS